MTRYCSCAHNMQIQSPKAEAAEQIFHGGRYVLFTQFEVVIYIFLDLYR